MIQIYKRELKSYFTSYTGYIFIAFTLAAAGIYSWYVNYLNQSPDFEYIPYNLSYIYIISVPILTMNSIAGERRQKTMLLLRSLPVSNLKIIAAKYLAQITIIAITVSVICTYPLILMIFGHVSLMISYCSILAFFLMGAAFTAIGLFVSSVCDNPTVAGGVTFAVLFTNFLLPTVADGMATSSAMTAIVFETLILALVIFIAAVTKNVSFAVISGTVLSTVNILLLMLCTKLYEGLIGKTANFLSLYSRMSYFISGVFDISGVVFYITLSILFCFFGVCATEKRRWS